MNNKQQLRNVAGYFLQLEERAKADCMPRLALFARRMGVRYTNRLRQGRG